MWALIAKLLTVLADAFKLWQNERLRDEGRAEVVREAEKDVAEAEAVADAAVTDPAVIERVRARFDKARRTDQ